jgi:hypothetical protein
LGQRQNFSATTQSQSIAKVPTALFGEEINYVRIISKAADTLTFRSGKNILPATSDLCQIQELASENQQF